MGLEVTEVISGWMEGEIKSFIKVWLLVIASLSYCYSVSRNVPKGPSRLLTTLPVVFLNLLLPLNLHTLHLGVSSAFFLAWLCNFKLLMFAFGKGPLSDSSLSLPHFLALACLPIKARHQNNPSTKTTQKGLKSLWNYGIKLLLIPLFLKAYDYEDHIHPKLTLVVYAIHIYVGLETLLAIVGGLARASLGIELEPQFDEPYLSTSLQDFWGRRWNIMVTRALRPSVYLPALNLSQRLTGRKWAPLPAILATFIASAVMHELIFFYMGRRWPTWEISCFFLLHGVCLVVEVALKKYRGLSGERGLPRIIAAPLTVGFVMVTGFWLFFPEFLRSNAMVRASREYEAMGAFFRDFYRAL
ncbi:acyl-CoA--sterol O-acyltransferase 1-like [Coffea arabica]|uniref:Acyl-CoA--sterol O-acyltransferase 1-like n=1 Tax=Coffea arabica TaxID=13443 RepID=A0A6P6T8H8_COFAR|nr:acyl-CoA--sterol O-acyltransferase 1-like [Coffea arabica]